MLQVFPGPGFRHTRGGRECVEGKNGRQREGGMEGEAVGRKERGEGQRWEERDK